MNFKCLQALFIVTTVLLGDCVLLKQVEPPNGTFPCAGNTVKFLCNTTYDNETTLTWQIIGSNINTSYFKNFDHNSSDTLRLPNGDAVAWETKTVTDAGGQKRISSSLVMNATSRLHNTTLACCSDATSHLCSDPADTSDGEFKKTAVLNISTDADCGNLLLSVPNITAALSMDQALLLNSLWGSISTISLAVSFVASIVALIMKCKYKRSPFCDDWLRITAILINATAFALINTLQLPIYHYNEAKIRLCSVLGFAFQCSLSSTTFITGIVSHYMCIKCCSQNQNLIKYGRFFRKCLIPVWIAIAATSIPEIALPYAYDDYGNAGGWCWIRHDKNSTHPGYGLIFQITTSSFGIVATLPGLLLMLVGWFTHGDYFRGHDSRHFVTTAFCFQLMFVGGNLISTISRIWWAVQGPPYIFICIQSIINPLWPLIVSIPTLVYAVIECIVYLICVIILPIIYV